MRYNQIKKDTYFKINTIPYFPFLLCGNSSANAQKWTANTKNTKHVLGKRNFGIFENFKPNQFFIGFDFVSSRLGSAFSSMRSSRIVTCYPGWHFNK
jgi:hypothetical protein